MANDYLSPKFGALSKYTFIKRLVPPGSSKSDLNYTDLNISGSAAPMLYDGWVAGLAVFVSGSTTSSLLTAGSVTAYVHKDSTEAAALAGVVVSTSGSGGTTGHTNYRNYAPGAYTFSAGDCLGVSVDTTTTTALTGGAASNGSPTVIADLYVILNPI